MTVTVSNLRIEEARSGLPIVSDIAFTIEPGRVLGLVGESGSGKTTISHAMLGYSRKGTRIAAGRVEIDGTDVLAGSAADRRALRGRLVSYVPQDPNAALNPAMTLGEQLTERLVHGDAQGRLGRAEALDRVREILTEVRLPADPAFLSSYPAQVSGGQQQRVGIAMAIASRPRLIVLDEPTTGLDVATQQSVLELVTEVCRSHAIAAIYISHDLSVVREVADDVMVLYAGRLVESAPADIFFSAPRHPYAAALLQSVPSLTTRRALTAIEGIPPALDQRNRGCLFRDRCTLAQADCQQEPAMTDGPHAVRCHFPLDRSQTLAKVPALPVRALPEATAPILEVAGLSARYGATEVLSDINLRLLPGECLSVVGESGSGKSTLSRCLIGLHDNRTGAIRLHGQPLAPSCSRRPADAQRKMQFVFQNPYGSLNPRRTVENSLALTLRHFSPGLGAREAQARVLATLDRVNLSARYAGRYPGELSGGEKQRVAIARALICDPEVMICDEVTSALDVSVQATIIELLRRLMEDGLSMIFVTHNLSVVRSLSDRIAVLDRGVIVEDGPTGQVMDSPRADYTRLLMEHSLSLDAA